MLAMRGNPMLLQAAIVADRWGMDVVDVLTEVDPVKWAVRVAGHLDLVDAERRANEQAQAQAKR